MGTDDKGTFSPDVSSSWGPSGVPEDAGRLFGIGQYRANVYNPNAKNYANPYEKQSIDYLSSYYNQLGGRATPTASAASIGSAYTSSDPYLADAARYGGARIATGASDEDRAYQMQLMKQLQGEAAGTAPSIAELQMKQGLQGSLANQMAAAASSKGMDNPALIQRNLAMGAAAGEQDIIGKAALARLQEQTVAQQQLGALSSSVRGADIGLAGQQAALEQQAGMFNAGNLNQFALARAGFEQANNQFNAGAKNLNQYQQAALEQQARLANQQAQMGMYGLNQQGQTWALGQYIGMGEADRKAAEQYEAQMSQNSIAQQQIAEQAYENAIQRESKIGGGLLGTVSAGALIGGVMSDERQKIEDNGEDYSGVNNGGVMDFFRRYSSNGTSNETSTIPDYAPKSDKSMKESIISAILNSSLGGGTLSDDDEKLDVADSKSTPYASVREMLSKTGTHSYRYKHPSMPGAAPGVYYGPMAQELEESDAGKSLVVETPYGKMVDTGRTSLVNLSAAAQHEKRIATLEKKMRTNGA